MRRLVLTWGALAIMLGAGPAAALAQSSGAERTLSSRLNHGMGQIGGASGAYVVDMNTGQVLFSDAAGIGRLPASVEKVYTTSTALLLYGPHATLTTSVLGTGTLGARGAWHGNLYLRGGGDPTFGSVGFDGAAYGTGAEDDRMALRMV